MTGFVRKNRGMSKGCLKTFREVEIYKNLRTKSCLHSNNSKGKRNCGFRRINLKRRINTTLFAGDEEKYLHFRTGMNNQGRKKRLQPQMKEWGLAVCGLLDHKAKIRPSYITMSTKLDQCVGFFFIALKI